MGRWCRSYRYGNKVGGRASCEEGAFEGRVGPKLSFKAYTKTLGQSSLIHSNVGSVLVPLDTT